jgi:NADH:ubiquinone oxidoreductase subunit 6 (subunit J)
LAGTSALTAVLLFLLGAQEAAVIELSVGAGLVTVLFVFAINIAGQETYAAPARLPRPLTWTLAVLFLALTAGYYTARAQFTPGQPDGATFFEAVWQNRSLDILLQVVLIFAGVLGVLGLLSESKPTAVTHPGEPAPGRREEP